MIGMRMTLWNHVASCFSGEKLVCSPIPPGVGCPASACAQAGAAAKAVSPARAAEATIAFARVPMPIDILIKSCQPQTAGRPQ